MRAVHEIEIVALGPVGLVHQLRGHLVVERRPRERVGDRDPDLIGHEIEDHPDGLVDVLPGLAEIAELEEEGDPDTVALEQSGGLVDLLDGDTLVHGVDDVLRTGFGADPGGLETGAGEIGGHPVAEHRVDPRLDGETEVEPGGLDPIGESPGPLGSETEDVVAEPDVLESVVPPAGAARSATIRSGEWTTYCEPQMGLAHHEHE